MVDRTVNVKECLLPVLSIITFPIQEISRIMGEFVHEYMSIIDIM